MVNSHASSVFMSRDLKVINFTLIVILEVSLNTAEMLNFPILFLMPVTFLLLTRESFIMEMFSFLHGNSIAVPITAPSDVLFCCDVLPSGFQ